MMRAGNFVIALLFAASIALVGMWVVAVNAFFASRVAGVIAITMTTLVTLLVCSVIRDVRRDISR
jgi:hypothetical protein